MSGLRAEDVDEDFDEASDSDLNDAFRGEDDLSERRRVKGRGYANPKIEKSFVTQQQLTAAMARVGSDIRGLTTQTKALAKSQTRMRRDTEQSLQMMMLLPMLMRPPTVTLTVAAGGLPVGTQLLAGGQDSTSMLLPMLLLGGMGGGGFGSSSSTNNSNSGMGGNDMMMLVLALTMMKK